jgi:hypothetical protein
MAGGVTSRLVRRTACVSVLLSAAIAAPAAAGLGQGDWEATGAGTARGSFAVVSVRQRVKHVVQRYVAVEDLTVDAPISCVNAPLSPAPVDVEVVGAVLRLNGNGSFSGGKIEKGTGTVVNGRFRRGKVQLTYRHVSNTYNAFEGGSEICRTGTVHLVAVPGHRRAVKDGVWLGKTASSEPVEFNVVAGGRALVTPSALVLGQTDYAFQLQPASGGDNCPGSNNTGYGSGSDTGSGPGAAFQISNALFVDPPGTFSNSELQSGDGPTMSGTFTGKSSAAGTFANPTAGCTGPPYNWTAGPG